MIVATYDKWREKKFEIALKSNKKVDRLLTCNECDGFGEVECDCCSHESTCQECDGEGKVEVSEMSIDQFNPSKQDYFKEVVIDAKAFCAWCNRDFLGEIGPFVKEFRGCA